MVILTVHRSVSAIRTVYIILAIASNTGIPYTVHKSTSWKVLRAYYVYVGHGSKTISAVVVSFRRWHCDVAVFYIRLGTHRSGKTFVRRNILLLVHAEWTEIVTRSRKWNRRRRGINWILFLTKSTGRFAFKNDSEELRAILIFSVFFYYFNSVFSEGLGRQTWMYLSSSLRPNGEGRREIRVKNKLSSINHSWQADRDFGMRRFLKLEPKNRVGRTEKQNVFR